MKEYRNTLLLYLAVALIYIFREEFSLILKIIGWTLLGLVSCVIFGGIVVIVSSFVSDKRMDLFRKRNSGNYFLVYSSNKRLKSTIEENLQPLISMPYGRIYKNREKINTELSEEEWRYLLLETESFKFPRLIKIKEKEVICESFHTEVYLLKHQQIDTEEYKKQVLSKLNKIKNE